MKEYFDKFQLQLLWLINTSKEARNFLQLPQEKFVKILPHAYHIKIGAKNQATAFTRPIYSSRLRRGLLYLDVLTDLGYVKDFPDSIEVLLHGLGWVKRDYPFIYFDDTGDVNANSGGDGNVFVDNGGSFATVRNATSGTAQAAADPVNLYASVFTSHSIGRVFFPFVNPSIPGEASIENATLKFVVSSVVAGSPTAHAVRSTQASTTALADADYDNILETPSSGAVTSCGSVSAGSTGQKTISLNETGIGHISPASDIKFALMEANDRSNTDPSPADNRASINTSNTGADGDKPKINIIYSVDERIFLQ